MFPEIIARLAVMVDRQHRARGQARRDALLRAAVAVAAERGAAGITHRAVTEKAGVPLATVSYFFDSIEALGDEALRTFAAESVEGLHALAALLAASEGAPQDIARMFADAVAPDLTATLAQMEAYLHAAREPAIRAAVADTLAAFRGVAEAAARTAGSPDPARVAGLLVAVVDGLVLHQLAQPRDGWRTDVEGAIRTVFVGHLVECGLVEQAVALSAAGRPAGGAPDRRSSRRRPAQPAGA
jgi:DNA-binding transcriptional regulator YbjK